MNTLCRRLALVAALALPGTVLAQQQPPPAEDEVPPRTFYLDFGGVDVTATADRPDIQAWFPRQRASFHPLIDLRTNFDDHLNSSVDEVR